MKTIRKSSGLKRVKTISFIGFLGLSMSACSTTSAGQNAQGAPITYKADQTSLQKSSAQRAPVTQTAEAPTYAPASANPAPVAPIAKPEALQPIPQIAQPAPQIAKPVKLVKKPVEMGIDTSDVDKTLYAHQRVGKIYTIMGKSYTPKHQPDYDVTGTASWYGDKFHGKLTASGEVYNMNDLTAAHKTLPLNSMVYVSNLETGKGMYVRVNDRGPFVGDRIIDLSRAVASELGMFNSGLGKVRVQYAGPAEPAAKKKPKYPRFAPAAPRQKPQATAEAPKYQPLRAFPRTFEEASPEMSQKAPYHAAPTSPVSKPVNPFVPQSQGENPLLNIVPQVQIPKQSEPKNWPAKPNTNDPVTLTIKGPVHLAIDKVAIGMQTGEFIPAINYRTILAQK